MQHEKITSYIASILYLKLDNPTVLTLAELEARIIQKDHFISTILGSEYIVVLGDKRELERLVEKRLAD